MLIVWLIQTMTDKISRKITFFLSYAHDDQKVFDHFERLFRNHITSKGWKIWNDKAIPLGADWHNLIQAALKECDYGILCVSAAFASSEYIQKFEITNILPKALPVLIDPYTFDDHPILSSKQFFQSLGKDYKEPDRNREIIAFSELFKYSSRGEIFSDHGIDALFIRNLVTKISELVNSKSNILNTHFPKQEHSYTQELKQKSLIKSGKFTKPPSLFFSKNLSIEEKKLLILEFFVERGTERFSVEQISNYFNDKIQSFDVVNIIEEFVENGELKKLPLTHAGYWVIQDTSAVELKINILKEAVLLNRNKKNKFISIFILVFILIITTIYFLYNNGHSIKISNTDSIFCCDSNSVKSTQENKICKIVSEDSITSNVFTTKIKYSKIIGPGCNFYEIIRSPEINKILNDESDSIYKFLKELEKPNHKITLYLIYKTVSEIINEKEIFTCYYKLKINKSDGIGAKTIFYVDISKI